ncbi:MAG: hypothetical protein ACRCYU_19430 [Nocardioides sp.]
MTTFLRRLSRGQVVMLIAPALVVVTTVVVAGLALPREANQPDRPGKGATGTPVAERTPDGRVPTIGERSRITNTLSGGPAQESSDLLGVSDDGNVVLFWSAAAELTVDQPGSGGGLYLVDRQAGTTAHIPVPNAAARSPALLSGDGKSVLYEVTPKSPSRNPPPVMRYDVASKQSTPVTVGPKKQPPPLLGPAALSADGQTLAFTGYGGLRNLPRNVKQVPPQYLFVADLQSGALTRVEAPMPAPSGAVLDLGLADVTDDGQHVAYSITATDKRSRQLVAYGIAVLDRATGKSWTLPGGLRSGAMAQIYGPGLSADGRFMIMTSTATDLVPEDTDALGDVVLVDRATGSMSLVTRHPQGERTAEYAAGSLSADGRLALLSRMNVRTETNPDYIDNLVLIDTISGEEVQLTDTGPLKNDGLSEDVVNGGLARDGQTAVIRVLDPTVPSQFAQIFAVGIELRADNQAEASERSTPGTSPPTYATPWLRGNWRGPTGGTTIPISLELQAKPNSDGSIGTLTISNTDCQNANVRLVRVLDGQERAAELSISGGNDCPTQVTIQRSIGDIPRISYTADKGPTGMLLP